MKLLSTSTVCHLNHLAAQSMFLNQDPIYSDNYCKIFNPAEAEAVSSNLTKRATFSHENDTREILLGLSFWFC